MDTNNGTPSLTSNMIARGGRPAFKRACATDQGYGSANQSIINSIVEDFRNDMEYDPRFDFRNANDPTITEREAVIRRRVDLWENRSKFGVH